MGSQALIIVFLLPSECIISSCHIRYIVYTRYTGKGEGAISSDIESKQELMGGVWTRVSEFNRGS
jgi:hypothetical protein